MTTPGTDCHPFSHASRASRYYPRPQQMPWTSAGRICDGDRRTPTRAVRPPRRRRGRAQSARQRNPPLPRRRAGVHPGCGAALGGPARPLAGGLALAAAFPPAGSGRSRLRARAAGRGAVAAALRGSLLAPVFGLALFLPLLSWLINLAWYAWVALAVTEAVIFAVLAVGQWLLLGCVPGRWRWRAGGSAPRHCATAGPRAAFRGAGWR